MTNDKTITVLNDLLNNRQYANFVIYNNYIDND